jgi:hypothetical protein
VTNDDERTVPPEEATEKPITNLHRSILPALNLPGQGSTLPVTESSMPNTNATFFLLVLSLLLVSCSQERTEPMEKTFNSEHLSFSYPDGFPTTSRKDALEITLSDTAVIIVEYLEGDAWFEVSDVDRTMKGIHEAQIAFGDGGMDVARLEKPITIKGHLLTGIYVQGKSEVGTISQSAYMLNHGQRGVNFGLNSLKSEHARFKRLLMDIIQSTTVR